MSIEIEWVDAAAEPGDGGAGWDDVVEAAGLVGLWRRAALAAYARAGLREVHLAVAREGGVPVGLFCLVAWLSSVPARRYAIPDQRRGVRPLICRLPFTLTPGYHLVPGRSNAHDVEVLRALTSAIAVRFGPAVPAVGFLAELEADALRFSWCPASVALSPVAVLDVPAGGAAEFLAAQARRRRRRLSEAAEQAAALPVAIFTGQRWRDPAVLSELDLATRLRHQRRPRALAPLPAACFDAMMDAGSAQLFGAEYAADAINSPGSAALALFDFLVPGRSQWLALTTGARDDLDGRDLLATALCLRELDAVAAGGCSRLTLGAGSLPTKLRMGARLSTLHMHIAPARRYPSPLRRLVGGRPRSSGRVLDAQAGTCRSGQVPDIVAQPQTRPRIGLQMSDLVSSVNDTLNEHLAAFAQDDARVKEMAEHYRRHGYVKLSGLVPTEVFDAVKTETMRLLDEHARRIDIHLKETGGSPRFMSTVSQEAIAADGELIPSVYRNQALKDALGQIADEPVHGCPWPGEEYVVIRQDRPGDTHGWHWGDFSFTVIWIIEGPDPSVGGTLQAVPNTSWNKEDPRVEEYLANNEIENWDNTTGDLYFLRSNTTLHRTIPLNSVATRIILNTCWASTTELDKPATHETMDAMFS